MNAILHLTSRSSNGLLYRHSTVHFRSVVAIHDILSSARKQEPPRLPSLATQLDTLDTEAFLPLSPANISSCWRLGSEGSFRALQSSSRYLPTHIMASGNGDRVPNSAFPREQLNKDLQKLVDKQDDIWDNIYEGQGPDTTETSVRYAAYANRLRTIMLSAHRYVAFTSEIGESFRPIAHPILVRSAYGISWAYILGDVGHEGYKAYRRNQRLTAPQGYEHFDGRQKEPMPPPNAMPTGQPVHIPAIEDYRAVMAQRAVFQSIASMGLPAFTIHSIVRYSGRALKTATNTTIRTWGPVGVSCETPWVS